MFNTVVSLLSGHASCVRMCVCMCMCVCMYVCILLENITLIVLEIYTYVFYKCAM
jgi:hypothetical protein